MHACEVNIQITGLCEHPSFVEGRTYVWENATLTDHSSINKMVAKVNQYGKSFGQIMWIETNKFYLHHETKLLQRSLVSCGDLLFWAVPLFCISAIVQHGVVPVCSSYSLRTFNTNFENWLTLSTRLFSSSVRRRLGPDLMFLPREQVYCQWTLWFRERTDTTHSRCVKTAHLIVAYMSVLRYCKHFHSRTKEGNKSINRASNLYMTSLEYSHVRVWNRIREGSLVSIS